MTSKTRKSRIDQIRDGASSMIVGDDTDGAIKGMVSVADQYLYVIKEHAIYRVLLADEIDPERTNASIPDSSQRIASAGSTSEIVGRSFLTANTLFNVSHFDQTFDRKPIMDLGLEIMKNLLAAQKIAAEVFAAEAAAKEELRQPQDRGFTIPSIDNLAESIKAYLQKVEHAAQSVFRFTQIFYDHRKKMFDGFAEKLESEYGNADEFTQFAKEMAKFMVFIRNTRHCIEHPNPKQKLVIQDFSLGADGKLSRPSIEIIHNETPQKEMAISDFVQQVSDGVLSTVEALMVHLAFKHMAPFGNFAIAVGIIPEGQRSPGSKVRAGYLIDIGNGWHRLG